MEEKQPKILEMGWMFSFIASPAFWVASGANIIAEIGITFDFKAEQAGSGEGQQG